MAFPTEREIAAAVRRLEGRAERRLVAALLRARAQLPLSVVERAILEGHLDTAIEVLGLDTVENALAEAQTLVRPARDLGWDAALRGLPKAVLDRSTVQLSLGAFQAKRPEVIRVIEDRALARVRAMGAATKEAVRATLLDGLQRGQNPRTTARAMRAVMGLTPDQAKSVRRYRAALLAEERPPDQVDRMADRYGQRLLRVRAEAIARTETMTALNEGRRTQWERLQADGIMRREEWEREWVVTDDDRLCPICEPFDGARAPVGGTFTASDGSVAAGPPLHVNCVLPGALVTASPRITATTERVFEGEVVRVRTQDGQEIACTPNHPVLTDRGWVAAGLLVPGQYVVCHGAPQRPVGGDDHREDVPPRIEEIAQAFREAPAVVAREVPVTAPDFHGDGEGSEVAVVRADGLLHDGTQTERVHPLGQSVFRGGAVRAALLTGLGTADLSTQGYPAPPHGRMSGPDLRGAFGSAHLRPLEPLGLAPGSRGTTIFPQTPNHDSTLHAEAFGDPVHGEPLVEPGQQLRDRHDRSARAPQGAPRTADSGSDDSRGRPHRPGNRRNGVATVEPVQQVPLVERRAWEPLCPGPEGLGLGSNRLASGTQTLPDDPAADPKVVTDLLEREAIPVHLNRVTNVDRFTWRGHVFNLETVAGWYAVNTIITHNCRCVERVVLRGFREGASTPRQLRLARA